MTTYINRKGQGYKETVSQYSKQEHGIDYRKEARKELREYQMSDSSGEYYLSSRCCNNWKV